MALIEEIDTENGEATSSEKPNAKMTDEERAALADKLDAQLDDFIDSLEKRGYTEGWPEDRWEEVNFNHIQFNHYIQQSMKIKIKNGFRFRLGNGQASIFYERATKTRR